MSLPQPEVNITGLSAFLSCLGRALADLDCMAGSNTSKWILAQTDNSYGDVIDCRRLNAYETTPSSSCTACSKSASADGRTSGTATTIPVRTHR